MSDAPENLGAKPGASVQDWRSTVFLPKTDFPMKAGLPQKEPAILARWQEQDLYGQVRKARSGREKFILHDGPPYANGDIHIGHALNHTLKDMVVRTQTLLGKDAPYVPGWDCHGLPIEWKIEEQYRKKKLDKPVPSGAEGDETALREFRAECRAYAQHWVETQREQLKRLGIGGDWDNPYLTMDYDAEATIVAELMKFAESGQLYRGAKPVMWSPVEKTALAEAEIEYEDIVSTQIDVAFEIVESPIAELVGAYAVVWTTTPWTIPANQAIGYNPEVDYYLFHVPDGRKLLIAEDLRDALQSRSGLQNVLPDGLSDEIETIVDEIAKRKIKGFRLAGTIARHPMHKLGGFFAEPRPFLAADFVTTDQGTGLVHEAPDHGEEDFYLCQQHGIDPVFAVTDDGRYREDWLWLGGQGSVINNKFNAPDGPICSDLRDAGALLAASADFQHSYPHSWRSKAKVIYRCTPQWFIAMDRAMEGRTATSLGTNGGTTQNTAFVPSEVEGRTLRSTALQAIADTRFVPEKGRNRLHSMVAERPDWVISRQRAWGVPIALFVERKTGELLVDPEVNRRIVEAVRAGGVDAWNDDNAAAILGPDRDPADYERVTDILDVWFDSGCTHVFTLDSGRWPEQSWPADLYLEGSDQHRGWFQSSLLESCGTRGRAPYDAVLTHGFTMDSKGMKMSKSLGNTVNPLDLMKEHGADILRLWALSVDFTEDHRIGKEILGGVADQYRKLRNTFRYLLGALDGFSDDERVSDPSAMPELERYMLHLLAELDGKLRRAVDDFDYNAYTRLIADFANNDLSAFYFDIRKDCLYCEVNPATGRQTDKRRAYRTVLDTLFHALVRWMAPVLVFTSEEVWGTRFPDAGSVHLLEWPELPLFPGEGRGPGLDPGLRRETDWDKLRALRTAVTEAIEPLRRDKMLGSSLEAEVTLPDADASLDLAELFIVSAVHAGDALAVAKTSNRKCGRCWRHLPEVTEDGALCARCEQVLHG
ncbi:isoleucine--tRNA ligase [Sphingomonas sp.]|uniref:isoleucine--tRNA ligase n=1 Tax=Sphingomonas sp. TaxID=28214 RepID=UPI001851BD6D|nr:isoleucine--tRNA ligase [Sphingomonas sp.]MBA3510726.1 isoleucine--tRNA ligase [Sphingomonas sp.]